MIQKIVSDFLKLESASGILLILATVLALIFANTSLDHFYTLFLSIQVGVHVGTFEIEKPLLLWINDGLMAIFFLLIGLELKRELIEGELSNPKQVILPASAAVGGMLVPAMVYIAFNYHDSQALVGWAIPAATDIAFALGILAMLGSRVPISLKVFLVSLAIIDDIGAIIIIALFYTSELSIQSLMIASLAILCLYFLNQSKVIKVAPYVLVGVILWVSVLKSGVHATLAGVVLAFFIPLRLKDEFGRSPARQLEHDLHSSVAFVIVPIFAFANAGLDLREMSLDRFLSPVPIGIALGLFLGKQLGVFLFAWITIKSGFAKLPNGVNWVQLYGVAVLCGVGFTMSLFIGSLAFEQSGGGNIFDDRLGILLGSLLSSVVGYILLNKSLPKAAT